MPDLLAPLGSDPPVPSRTPSQPPARPHEGARHVQHRTRPPAGHRRVPETSTTSRPPQPHRPPAGAPHLSGRSTARAAPARGAPPAGSTGSGRRPSARVAVGSPTYLRGDDGAITPEPPEESPPRPGGEATRPGSRTNRAGRAAGTPRRPRRVVPRGRRPTASSLHQRPPETRRSRRRSRPRAVATRRPAQVDLPAMEHEVLALPGGARHLRARACADRRRDPWTFYEGPPTANGMPGVDHVEAESSRTFSRASRRCGATTWSARPAGTATACPSRSRWRRSSVQREGRHRGLRGGRVQRAVPRVGAAPRRRVEATTQRMG